jgi:hypothetical protein
MISERGNPITIINGVRINKADLNMGSRSINNYAQGCLYIDNFKETSDEWKRIREYRSKPCPPDFPKELKPYWKGNLEFSFTPYQSGWMYLAEQKKVKARK